MSSTKIPKYQKDSMLMDIILYLLQFIQYQHKQICWLLNFICRYIPLKQWAFDDSHSPKYQKFKIDNLPVIKTFIKQDWQFLLEYYLWKYGKPVKPVQRRNGKTIPEDTICQQWWQRTVPMQSLWSDLLFRRSCYNTLPAYLSSLWEHTRCQERS